MVVRALEAEEGPTLDYNVVEASQAADSSVASADAWGACAEFGTDTSWAHTAEDIAAS
jgi:hypothetical protein